MYFQVCANDPSTGSTQGKDHGVLQHHLRTFAPLAVGGHLREDHDQNDKGLAQAKATLLSARDEP